MKQTLTHFFQNAVGHITHLGKKIRDRYGMDLISEDDLQNAIHETVAEEMKQYDEHTIKNPFGAPRNSFMGRGLN